MQLAVHSIKTNQMSLETNLSQLPMLEIKPEDVSCSDEEADHKLMSTSTYLLNNQSCLAPECRHHQHVTISHSYMETLTTLTLQNSVRGPKFYCYLCDYYLHTRLSMITHMKMHLKPFCVVCFETFTTCMDMNAHALESHPYVFPTAAISRIEVGDFFDFSQTEAPPNSPNHSFETQLDLNADFVNNNSIPTLLTEKLLEHQMEVEQRDSNIVNSDDILNHQPEEIQKTPSPPQANKAPTTRNSRTKEKRTPPVVSTGKVLKNSKPKGSASKIVSTMRTERVDRDDSVLRRITSRFGRSISLKVPQF